MLPLLAWIFTSSDASWILINTVTIGSCCVMGVLRLVWNIHPIQITSCVCTILLILGLYIRKMLTAWFSLYPTKIIVNPLSRTFPFLPPFPIPALPKVQRFFAHLWSWYPVCSHHVWVTSLIVIGTKLVRKVAFTATSGHNLNLLSSRICAATIIDLAWAAITVNNVLVCKFCWGVFLELNLSTKSIFQFSPFAVLTNLTFSPALFG